MNEVQIALSAAKHWELNRNYNWATRNYDSALLNMLKIAVSDYNEPISGIKFLEESGCAEILTEAYNSYRILIDEINSKKWPPSVIGGNFHLCVLTHLGWLLRQYGEAQKFIELACDPRFKSTNFLTEYAQALKLFASKIPYKPKETGSRGLERYWWEYLQLISDFTNRRDSSGRIEVVQASFARKNKDRRLADNYGIEGTGKDPVRWDFRLASILKYASEFYNT